MLRFCARRVLDAETAVDLCAETFAQAFRSRRGFKGATEQEARAWLFTIARRQVARYLKKGELDRRARNAIGLDELEREIARIAYAAREVHPKRRWWRSGALLVLLPLGIATVAVGAVTSGILTGEPVKNTPGCT